MYTLLDYFWEYLNVINYWYIIYFLLFIVYASCMAVAIEYQDSCPEPWCVWIIGACGTYCCFIISLCQSYMHVRRLCK